YIFFLFTDPSTTEIYTLSLHDALPICAPVAAPLDIDPVARKFLVPGEGDDGRRMQVRQHLDQLVELVGLVRHRPRADADAVVGRSEEHTSELQSQSNLVCRLLLEKKKK